MKHRPPRLAHILSFGTLAILPALAWTTPAAAASATTMCEMTGDDLAEISGIAFSSIHDGVLWAHNDSGGGPRVYALDSSTCEVIATVRLDGIKAVDFEAMAAGIDERGRGVLWIADIGDNTAERKQVFLHRVVEPQDLRDQTVSAETFAVRYDEPADAEALLVGDDALWIITKGLATGSVQELALPLRSDRVNRTEAIGTEEGLVTDAADGPDRRHYVVRDYTEARIYEGAPSGNLVARLPLPDQVQGEAITWTPDGTALVIASENDKRIIRVDLPAQAWATPTTDTTPTTEPDPPVTTSEETPAATADEQAPAPNSDASSTAPQAQPQATSVLDPAEQLGSLSLAALGISGGVFLISTLVVIVVVVVRERRRTH